MSETTIKRLNTREMIEEWVQQGKIQPKELNVLKLYAMLESAGLIAKTLESRANKEIYAPTYVGNDIGIELDEPNENDEHLSWRAMYTPEARQEILRRYKDGELPYSNPLRPYIPKSDIEPETWVKLFHRYLDELTEYLWDIWDSSDDEGKRQLIETWNKSRVQESDGKVEANIYEDTVSARCYMVRYGELNACEYSVLLNVVMENTRKLKTGAIPVQSMVSIGCGPEMDLFSLLYEGAFHRCSKITYTPVDISAWGSRFSKWLAQESGQDYVVPRVIGLPDVVAQEAGIGAGDFFKEDAHGVERKQGIFLFPKVLSELDEEVMDSLVKGILNTTFTNDEVFVCVSHLNEYCFEGNTELRSSVENGDRVIAAFCDAMADTHNMITGDKLQIPDIYQHNNERHLRCASGSDSKYPWFSFGPERSARGREGDKPIAIREIDYRLSWFNSNYGNARSIYKLIEQMREFDRSVEVTNPRSNCYRSAEDRDFANMGVAFQIVKFVKKG